MTKIMYTSYVLMSSLSSLKESRASDASTEIDIMPSTSCKRLRRKLDSHYAALIEDSEVKKW